MLQTSMRGKRLNLMSVPSHDLDAEKCGVVHAAKAGSHTFLHCTAVFQSRQTSHFVLALARQRRSKVACCQTVSMKILRHSRTLSHSIKQKIHERKSPPSVISRYTLPAVGTAPRDQFVLARTQITPSCMRSWTTLSMMRHWKSRCIYLENPELAGETLSQPSHDLSVSHSH